MTGSLHKFKLQQEQADRYFGCVLRILLIKYEPYILSFIGCNVNHQVCVFTIQFQVKSGMLHTVHDSKMLTCLLILLSIINIFHICQRVKNNDILPYLLCFLKTKIAINGKPMMVITLSMDFYYRNLCIIANLNKI